MRSKILYVPEDIVLDLSKPDLGHPAGLEIIQRHYWQSGKAGLRHNRRNPAFRCLRHLDGTNPGLFIKRIRDEWWAVHYEQGRCRSYQLPAPMSDEHKRQTEYWVRAAEDAGWRAETEHTLPTGIRPDALIHGPVPTGLEVQRYHMKPAVAVNKNRKAFLAGVNNVWFSTPATAPKWAWRVPTVLNREMGIPGEGHPWDRLPPRRSVTSAGLRVIRAARCSQDNFGRCPHGRSRRSWCGDYHPRPEPWRGLAVDDVAARCPGGEIVPMRFWGVRTPGSSQRDAVFLVSQDSLALYEEMTGGPGHLHYDPSAEVSGPHMPSQRVECRNPQPTSTKPDSVPELFSEGLDAVSEAAGNDPVARYLDGEPGTGGLRPLCSQPLDVVDWAVNTRWAARCGKCGVAPPGPGGILCPPCRHAIETRPIPGFPGDS